jgi:hypothetical protein
VIADYFAAKNPLFELEDPYPILSEAPNPNGGSPALVPVLLPIRQLNVFNDSNEMVLQGTVA